MKTVKEVSKITGLSVRTLHYYDEIGLLKPTEISESGYRLYDDKALEVLQQILFFKEFSMPLKDIKSMIENPDLDKNKLLQEQKKILVQKKERLERIIASIDEILKGENKMDFTIFNKTDIEQMYHAMVNNMSDTQKRILIKEYGSMEGFEKQFLENASSEEAQKNFAKVVSWYGDKESAMSVATNPNHPKVLEAYAQRYKAVIEKLVDKVGSDVNTFEVKEIVGELDFVSKQLYQMNDMSAFMLDMADKYQNDINFQVKMDSLYGDGSTVFIGQALAAFYKR